MRKSNLRERSRERRRTPAQRPRKYFQKFIEENLHNLKKYMPLKVQEVYRTPNKLDQKRITSRVIIIMTLNMQNKERILKLEWKKSNEYIKAEYVN